MITGYTGSKASERNEVAGLRQCGRDRRGGGRERAPMATRRMIFP
jgi:hypothetical protein